MNLVEDQTKQSELTRMKRVATGLLLGVALIFIVALRLQRQYPWVNFVRATAEAAMVGAFADWFAVIALFRHPLGLPIPHTAIIPHRKDSIGVSIGRFVEENFLVESIIVDKLRSMNITQQVAHLIIQPEPSNRIAKLITTGIVGTIQVINDVDVQALIEHGIVTRLQTTKVAPLLGRVLTIILSGKRQADLLYGIIKLAAQLMDENRTIIRDKISKETPWWLPRAVDRRIYQRVFDTVDETLQEISVDPNHPLHAKFNDVVCRIIDDLQHKPELIERVEAIKEDLLKHQIVREFAASLWQDIKGLLLNQSTNPDSYLYTSLQRAIYQFGELLLRDEVLADKINRWIEKTVAYAVREYRHEFGQLIAQTVSNWDATSTAQKIELQIGADLQFIRINGTVVGGIAGLLIYIVSVVVG